MYSRETSFCKTTTRILLYLLNERQISSAVSVVLCSEKFSRADAAGAEQCGLVPTSRSPSRLICFRICVALGANVEQGPRKPGRASEAFHEQSAFQEGIDSYGVVTRHHVNFGVGHVS